MPQYAAQSRSSSSSGAWPPQSPSPSPPAILLSRSTRIDANGYHSESENESEISGIIFMDSPHDSHHALNNEKHDIPNGHSRHFAEDDGHEDDEIEIFLPQNGDTNTNHNGVHNGHEYQSQSPSPPPPQLSPSPPWGRSPSPPPSEYFHKPTKKKSRWDDKSEFASSSTKSTKSIKSKSSTSHDPLLDAGVQSLIHSIGLQQQKQKKVEPLILDEHGNVVKRTDSLEDEEALYEVHPNGYEMDSIHDDDADTDDMYDPEIEVKPATRRGRGRAFKFIEQGTYTDRANTMRAMELQNSRDKPPRLDIELVAKKLHDDEGLEWLDRVPNVEWWDAPLLTDKNDYNSPYKQEMVTDLIENPKILRPELLREGVAHNTNSGGGNNSGGANPNGNGDNNGNSGAIPWILTKKERKKMKRMKKKEEHQQRTDEIRLGLREPPEPRLKVCHCLLMWIESDKFMPINFMPINFMRFVSLSFVIEFTL